MWLAAGLISLGFVLGVLTAEFYRWFQRVNKPYWEWCPCSICGKKGVDYYHPLKMDFPLCKKCYKKECKKPEVELEAKKKRNITYGPFGVRKK